jgi:hypothetical protein
MLIPDLAHLQTLMSSAAYASLPEARRFALLTDDGVPYPDDGNEYRWDEETLTWRITND